MIYIIFQILKMIFGKFIFIFASFWYINNRKYNLNNYKYFIVHDRSNGGSISLIPNKRLAPSISVNFSNKDANDLINKLGSFMPIEHQENDIFDNILRFIGF